MLTKDSTFSGKVLAPVGIDRKAVSDTGEFEGYGSIFGVKDQGCDIVMPGAFRNSLSARPAEQVKMLWQHRPDSPIGKWMEIREDGRGLWVKGKINLSLQQGRETYEMLKDGIIDGLSIGYRTIEDNWDRDEDARRLIEVDLREISCVTFPLHEMATVSQVKGSISTDIDAIKALSDAERLLREVGRSLSKKEATEFISVVSKIARREAGDGPGGVEAALKKLTQLMRG